MPKLQRTSPLAVLAFAVTGIAAGVLAQLIRSSMGSPPIVPPVSLAATLVVIAVVLLVLAVLLRRAVARGRRVNPFHAVRVLAGARAAQYAGALFGGCGAGFLLQVLTRSVAAPTATWLPSLFMLLGGLILVACGIAAERMCRVPPEELGERDDRHPHAENAHDTDAEHGGTPDPAAG